MTDERQKKLTWPGEVLDKLKSGYHLRRHQDKPGSKRLGGVSVKTMVERWSVIRLGSFEGKGPDAYDNIEVDADTARALIQEGKVVLQRDRFDRWEIAEAQP